MAGDLRRRLRDRLRPVPPGADQLDPDFVVPADVRPHLISRERMEPLWPQFREFGKGKPGVTRETPEKWVVRDEHGEVVGGAIADRLGDSGFHPIDIEVEPRYRRRGFATQLFAAMTADGIDIEKCSNASLRLGMMTELGYAFQVGRRRNALASGVGPLAERLRETGIEGPKLEPGWIPPSIEEPRRRADEE